MEIQSIQSYSDTVDIRTQYSMATSQRAQVRPQVAAIRRASVMAGVLSRYTLLSFKFFLLQLARRHALSNVERNELHRSDEH